MAAEHAEAERVRARQAEAQAAARNADLNKQSNKGHYDGPGSYFFSL